MIGAMAVILGFQLVGEVLTRALDLTVPGPVIGMILLVGLGLLRPAWIERLRPVTTTLLANLSLFFVPAGVGVIAHTALIRQDGLALALAITVSTALAIAVGAIVFQGVARLTGGTDPDARKIHDEK